MTAIMTTKTPGSPDESVQRMTFLSNGLCRVELPEGRYSIVDNRRRKAMAVDTKNKKAMIFHSLPTTAPTNPYENFRNIHKESVKRLPDRTIDGKRAVGFTAKVGQDTASIWVDPETNLPVRMESSPKDPQGREATVIIHDIRFDEDVDESLFRLEPPEGYTVTGDGMAQVATGAGRRTPEITRNQAHGRLGAGSVRHEEGRGDFLARQAGQDRNERNGSWMPTARNTLDRRARLLIRGSSRDNLAFIAEL